jgi:hypothetical protein
MAGSETLMLSDKSVIPTEKQIFSFIGENKVHWHNILSHVFNDYKDTAGSWNYYNDGKQWLYKLTQKKKTIFWVAILADTFRVTFYFGDKALPLIENSDLPSKIKEDFITAKKYGLIRPVSIKVSDNSDVENVLKLVAIKTKIK